MPGHLGREIDRALSIRKEFDLEACDDAAKDLPDIQSFEDLEQIDLSAFFAGLEGCGFGFFGDPVPDPIVLSRNGRQFEFRGQTTIRSGAEVTVDTARESVPLTLSAMNDGSWVIFELPGFTTAAAGTEQSSLAALRDASDTSYYRDRDTLWVKLVVDNTGGEGGPGLGFLGPSTSIDVSR